MTGNLSDAERRENAEKAVMMMAKFMNLKEEDETNEDN